MNKKIVFISILFLAFLANSCSAQTVTPQRQTAAPLAGTAAPVTSEASITFDPKQVEKGIYLLPMRGDSQYTLATFGNVHAVSTNGFASHIRTKYFYFVVTHPEPFRQTPITLQVEYLDQGQGTILLEYDSTSTQSADPVYKAGALAYRLGTNEWKTATYTITDAAFQHRENFQTDFRISGEQSAVIIKSVRILLGAQVSPTATLLPTAASPAEYPAPLSAKAVFTYYFYWYDAPNGIFNLTNAPVDFQTISWRDPSWQLKQLQEMKAAGIDVVMPVYWYLPDALSWSKPGLQIFARTLDEMRAGGQTPPAVAMFVDTTSMTGEDLRQEAPQQELYDNIKFFFTTVPRGYWALTEQTRPVIWFYTATWPTAYDQTFIDYVYQHFQADFGVRPYLVFEGTWDYPTTTVNGAQVKDTNAPHLKYDAVYSWGGAVAPRLSQQIAEIGPGYDDHAVEDRIPPTFTDRADGLTYQRNFALAVKCDSPWLAIETWSEYMEGTEIAETLQYGRQYLDLTRALIPDFKAGVMPAGVSLGDFGDATQVSFTAGSSQAQGISISPSLGDGQYSSAEVGGTAAVQSSGGESAYLYFLVDNAFYFNDQKPLTLTVEYYDEGSGSLWLDYDSAACAATFNADTMYKRVRIARLGNSGQWKTATIAVTDARFSNNENFSADFRISDDNGGFALATVTLKK